MTTDDALALLRTIAADLGLRLAAPLTLEADLKRDLGIDSIDVLDVLFELNERCGIGLTVDDLLARPDASRVATLVASITTAVAARAACAKVAGNPGADGNRSAGGNEAER